MLKTANLSMVLSRRRDLKTNIFVLQANEKHICTLRRVLYGLPKFGERWHTKGLDSVAYFTHPLVILMRLECKCLQNETWYRKARKDFKLRRVHTFS